MIFKKKKRMVDIRELQRKGIVVIPKNNSPIVTNREGFVEVGKDTNRNIMTSEKDTRTNFLNLSKKNENFQTEEEGYNKREVDAKIIELDNKIYKLENRVELLERKIGINNTGLSERNLIGW